MPASSRPRRADVLVGDRRHENIDVPLHGQAGRVSSYLKVSILILSRASDDWIRANYIREGNLLYSFKC
jgi:hypothetical protein